MTSPDRRQIAGRDNEVSEEEKKNSKLGMSLEGGLPNVFGNNDLGAILEFS